MSATTTASVTVAADGTGTRLIAAPRPTAARRHASYSAARGGTAVTMLTVYMVCLYAAPSYLQWTPLGSLGKPATIWGLVLLAWWTLSQLHPRIDDGRLRGRAALTFLLLFCTVVLISYAAALLRGQPSDQIGSATTSLVRIASWSGVLLVLADGIRTRHELMTLFRRLSIVAGILAALGFMQLVTGSTLLEWTSRIPGLAVEWGGMMDLRGGLLRPTGTATHPLEFSSSLTALLPISLAHAFAALRAGGGRAWGWLLAPALVLSLLLLTVSRSAIIGVALAVLALLPFMPRAFRTGTLAAIGVGCVVVAVLLPRVVMTTLEAFTGIAEDSSTLSRANALERVPEFASNSPLYGAGWGTFLPRYYIFDNAWVLMLIEAGIAGVAMFALMLITSALSAVRTGLSTVDETGRLLAGATAAAVITVTVLMAFFDGLSFGIFVGTLFIVVGLSLAANAVLAPER